MTDLVHMQNAHVTQTDGDKGKSDWVIKQNITGKTLDRMPASLSEKEAFSILHLIRRVELNAFNAGIRFKASQVGNNHKKQIAVKDDIIKQLKQHNAMLAEKLESLIGDEG